MFLFHWREESQHAILDELQWRRVDAQLSAGERDAAVDDLIALVGAVDGILQAQARADADYFCAIVPRTVPVEQQQALQNHTLGAYRWQYVVSGVQEPHFQAVPSDLVTPAQMERIVKALAPLSA